MPLWEHLTPEEYRAKVRPMIEGIVEEARERNRARGKRAMGVAVILARHPHRRPEHLDRSPELVDRPRPLEVPRGDAMVLERRAEPEQRLEHACGVRRVAGHEDVEITRRPPQAMHGEGVGSDDQEPDPTLHELVQQVPKVVVEDRLTQRGVSARTILAGIRDRS